MKIKTCELNMDTASMEIQLSDSSVLSIYCPNAEDEIAHTTAQRAERDWLLYNEPLTYAAMILNGTERAYLCGPFLYSLDDGTEGSMLYEHF